MYRSMRWMDGCMDDIYLGEMKKEDLKNWPLAAWQNSFGIETPVSITWAWQLRYFFLFLKNK